VICWTDHRSSLIRLPDAVNTTVLDSVTTVRDNGPMNNNAFAAAVPTLFKMVLGQMHRAHKVLVETYGVDNLRSALMTTKQDAARLDAIDNVINKADGSLNDDKMVDVAYESAKQTAVAMTAKVAGKVGKLSGVTVRHVNGCEFNINGTDASGRSVQLVQTTVYKFSPNGKMFAQFPCRIYVDGKFTAEANF
jgi:hypothetical protein